MASDRGISTEKGISGFGRSLNKLIRSDRDRCVASRSLSDLISLLSDLPKPLIHFRADPAIRSQIGLLLGPSWRLLNGIRRHDGIGGVDVSARHAVSLVPCKRVIVGSFQPRSAARGPR